MFQDVLHMIKNCKPEKNRENPVCNNAGRTELASRLEKGSRRDGQAHNLAYVRGLDRVGQSMRKHYQTKFL